MKLKIKKHDPFLVCYEYSPITFQEYSDKIYRYTNKQIRKIFKAVFHKECEIGVVWAKYLIQYELARQQCVLEGRVEQLAPGSKFRNSYMAVRRMDLNNVNENLKTLIAYDLKHQTMLSQEKIMKKKSAIKKAVEVKKSKCIGITTGLSVYDAWVYCFKKNEKEHKPDEEITKFLLAEFPDHQIKSFHAVHACRIGYNNGRFTKGVKPEVKSVRYLADGTEWKRGKKSSKVKEEPKQVAPKKATVKKAIVKKAIVKKAKIKKAK